MVTLFGGIRLDDDIADEIAEAMKEKEEMFCGKKKTTSCLIRFT